MGILFTDDMTTLTGFGISGGTAAADTEFFCEGTQSVKLTGTASNLYWSKANIGMNINAMLPNTWFRLVFYLPETLTTGDIYVYFYSGNSTGNYGTDYIRKTTVESVATLAAGWNVQDLPLPTTGNGTFDPTNITGFGIQFTKASGVMYVDSLQILRPATTDLPTFILTFDDGYDEHATIAAPELNKYGWKGVFSVVPTLIGTGGMATLAQIQAMDAAGHIIANHSYEHKAWSNGGVGGIPLTTAEKEYSILRGQRYLRENGLGRNADIFTWAYSFAGTQAELDMAMKLNRCVLNTGSVFTSRLNTTAPNLAPKDWGPCYQRNFVARSLQDKNATLPFSAAQIDSRIATGKQGVTFVMIHQLSANSGYLTEAEFRAACAHLRAKELAGLCRVVSLNEWLAATPDRPEQHTYMVS
jgi:hypothetical protein